jgi:hypothetical protein
MELGMEPKDELNTCIDHVEEDFDISFDSLNYTVGKKKKEKKILQNLSGVFRSRELVAVMGCSGTPFQKLSIVH